MLLLKNANVIPVSASSFFGDVAIENGKIAAVGKNLAFDGAEIYDVGGKYVMPGLVDAHSHVGVFESGTREVDHNEKGDPTTPEMRILDSIFVEDMGFAEAREYGITTSVVCPGSINLVGGAAAVVKNYGTTVGEMLVEPFVAMKMAFGENPKFRYTEIGKSPKTRMCSAALVREILFKTREYADQKEKAESSVPFNFRLEALLPVMRREKPMKIHCHRADDIVTAIRIMDEFNLRYTLDHCTEGYKILDILKSAMDKNCEGIIIGPSTNRRLKLEQRYKIGTRFGKYLYEAGIPFAICTDFPDSMHETLTLVAGRSVAEGLPEDIALRAITLEPAKIIGLADRIGSLEPGKDADIAVFNGYPLEYTSVCCETYIDGKLVYKRHEDHTGGGALR